jgi:hypothetical protein
MGQVLYITAESITWYRTQRHGAIRLGRFGCDASGHAALAQQLADAEAQPLSILVDLIEEEFREETLPHTLGRDRARLHGRHAGKMFRTTPFRYYHCLGRQRSGRRDDQVLFSALTNRDNIEPILTLLDQIGVPVKGVHSLPITTGRLLKALAANRTNNLIVTAQPDGGLRETFMRDGEVRFSRLAPINDNTPADYGHILNAEVHKTRRYLHTLRLLPQDQGLEVYALCDRARVEALHAMPNDTADINVHAVDLSDLARLLGFRDHPDIQFSDALFCYLLDKHPVKNHYALAQHLRNWRGYQARQALLAASWLLAVSAATLSGMNIVDGKRLEVETRQVARITDEVNAEYHSVRKDLPIEPVAALSMREAIQLADQITANPVDQEQLFKLLGRGFFTKPDLVMDTLTWFVTDAPNAETLSAVDQIKDGVAAAVTPYLVAKVGGHVRKFNGSYRQAHQQIDSMAKWIAGQPGILRAAVIRKPLNTKTDSALQGGIAAQDDKEAAEFELRIVLELGDGPV